MSANTISFFVFHMAPAESHSPKPAPEWPPTEPSPIPPVTDPVPTVPPVTSIRFERYSFLMN